MAEAAGEHAHEQSEGGPPVAQSASAATETAFTVGATTRIDCWVMVLYSAYRSGRISRRWIHDICTWHGGNWSAEMVRRLTATGRPRFDRHLQTPVPQRGDIVPDRVKDHTVEALARGCDDPANGHTCVVELGPPPWR